MTLKRLLKEYPTDTLEPGDRLTTNDPWQGTGHLPDLTMVTPIFREGRLIAFVGCIAHSPDMGEAIECAVIFALDIWCRGT